MGVRRVTMRAKIPPSILLLDCQSIHDEAEQPDFAYHPVR